MNAFVDEHRARFGIEPICKALQVAPSGYRRYAARQRDPASLPQRSRRDAVLVPQIQRVWDSNMQVYGADNERLMRVRGLRGVIRGKAVRTTIVDAKAPCPLDRARLKGRDGRAQLLDGRSGIRRRGGSRAEAPGMNEHVPPGIGSRRSTRR